jgi:hypothetical protein
MSEREATRLRELKETAYALYQRGRYAQCAETYALLARLLPRDANVRVRLAEACRRAGQRAQAISAYRDAAQVLLSLGCESRARGALKAALELDPRDPVLQMEVVRLGHGASQSPVEDEMPSFDRLPPTPPPTRARFVPPPPPPDYVLNAAQEPVNPGRPPAVPAVAPVNPAGTRGMAPSRPPGMGSGPGRDALLPHPRTPTATEVLARAMANAAAMGAPRMPDATSLANAAAVAPMPPRVPGVDAARALGAAAVRNAPPGITPLSPAEAQRVAAQPKALPGAPLALPALPRRPPGALAPSEPAHAPVPDRPTVKVIALLNRSPEAMPTPAPPAPMPPPAMGTPHASSLTMPPLAVLPYRPEMRRLAPNVVALRVSPQARWVIIRSESDLQVSRSEALPEEHMPAY